MDFYELEAEIPRLTRYARALAKRYSRDEQTKIDFTNELVQDTLVRALSKRNLWQPGTDLRAWLFTILHNEYVDYVRKSARQIRAVRLDPDCMAASPARAHDSMVLEELRLALDVLPSENREAIVLTILEGLPHERIAKLMKVPVGTVRSRISRSRRRLRKLLEGTAVGESGHTGCSLRTAAAIAAKRRRRDKLAARKKAA